jgi:hypothetical protein
LAPDKAALRKRIDELQAKPSHDRYDTCELELLLLHLKSREELLQDLPALRSRLQAVDQAAPGPKTTDASTDAELLAEASHLTEMIHRSYLLTWLLEQTRQRMVNWMLAAAAATYALLAVAILRRARGVEVVDAVVVAGVLGGFTSCLRRISAVTSGPDPVSAIQTLGASRSGMIAAPLLGAIFGVLLYVCFTGGLVSGVLFPTFTVTPDMDYKTPFAQFLFGTIAVMNNADFAKLLVWSFIAGFAERLMPDLIDQMVAKVSGK